MVYPAHPPMILSCNCSLVNEMVLLSLLIEILFFVCVKAEKEIIKYSVQAMDAFMYYLSFLKMEI